jgi:hypothetical protein
MRLLLAASLLVLAACTARELPAPEGVASNDPRLRECRREAVSSPAVLAIRRAMPPPTYGDAYARAREDIDIAERDAFNDCLVREGAMAVPPGGVERVRAPSFDPPQRGIGGTELPQAARPTSSGY